MKLAFKVTKAGRIAGVPRLIGELVFLNVDQAVEPMARGAVECLDQGDRRHLSEALLHLAQREHRRAKIAAETRGVAS